VRPQLEGMEDRLVPTSLGVYSSYAGLSNVAVITGTDQPDTITIHHHNDQDGNAVITVHDSTGYAETRIGKIDNIYIDTGKGDDVVRYSLTGDLTRSMRIEAHLGQGNDRFTATLDHDINADRNLKMFLYGEEDNDLITVYGTPTAPDRLGDFLENGMAINAGGLKVGAGGLLRVDADGGTGADQIFFDYDGELDGTLLVRLKGRAGSDLVSANLNLRDGSTGQVGEAGTSSSVWGGDDEDHCIFMIKASHDTFAHCPVYAEIDGGGNGNTGEFTDVVTDLGGWDGSFLWYNWTSGTVYSSFTD
jgi:hypothetical protein